MKKKIFRTAIVAASAVVFGVGLRRFGPALAERGMKKCHEMMAHMSQERPPEQAVPGLGESHEDSELAYLREEQTPSLVATA